MSADIQGTSQKIGTLLFCFALVHTFSCAWIRRKLGNRFHFLSELELVFGFWSVLFLLFLVITGGFYNFTSQINLTEPVFVMTIMAVSSTRTVEQFSSILLQNTVKRINSLFPKFNKSILLYLFLMILGPLLGSLITEPAAMVVTAVLLNDHFFTQSVSNKFKYHALALLLLNISIGGVLTHFAAPPVVMVARTWGWDLSFMFTQFGWKAFIAILINTSLSVLILRKELLRLEIQSGKISSYVPKITHVLINLGLIALTVLAAHHWSLLLVLLVGFYAFTKKFNKEPVFVGIFLAGLVVLGKVQAWWLEPIISSLNGIQLFSAATLLTSITDNALLTYLGTQIQNLAPELKYYLVAGAVTGGGLTVIANAPNPVAFGILKGSFENEEISAADLFRFSLIPTFITALCFYLF